ncbi:17 kDa surface antigen [Thauera aromatica K172]|uniref:17 kDa surface antigen n=2 Tax=Thauera aromatica TaxID=59405 RepID=A0A2R4BRR5_THAAR|nr:17 kDa surface antigen [Thauera aromatica K172]
MKTNMKLTVLAVATCVGLSTGCANMSQNAYLNNENIGTVVGAAAGVLIGSQVGKGSGRTAAMLVGALAGGMLGKSIGASLDERDRQALAAQSQQVLDATQDGQVTTWRSEHSGATAQITPVSTETFTRPVAVKRTAKVQSVSNLQMLNKPYRAIKSANVRSAPDANAEKVGGLAAGSTFTAIGRTDNNWIAVGRRGVTVGYVHAPLVAPAPVVQQAAKATTGAPKAADTATDLDALDVASAQDQGFDLDSAPVVEDKVAATTTCRTLQYTVNAGGKSDKQDVKACQAADGAWELS